MCNIKNFLPSNTKLSDFTHSTSSLENKVNHFKYSKPIKLFEPLNIELLIDFDRNAVKRSGFKLSNYKKGSQLHLINFGGTINIGFFPNGSGSGIEINHPNSLIEGIHFKFI